MGFYTRTRTVNQHTGIEYYNYEPTIHPKGALWIEGKTKPFTKRIVTKQPEPWYKSLAKAKVKKIRGDKNMAKKSKYIVPPPKGSYGLFGVGTKAWKKLQNKKSKN